MTQVKVLGVSDEITTCEHCGKKHLKCTVALSIDGGEAVYFGRDCAAHALGNNEPTATDLKNIERKGRLQSAAQRWVAQGYTAAQIDKGLSGKGYGYNGKTGEVQLSGQMWTW